MIPGHAEARFRPPTLRPRRGETPIDRARHRTSRDSPDIPRLGEGGATARTNWQETDHCRSTPAESEAETSLQDVGGTEIGGVGQDEEVLGGQAEGETGLMVDRYRSRPVTRAPFLPSAPLRLHFPPACVSVAAAPALFRARTRCRRRLQRPVRQPFTSRALFAHKQVATIALFCFLLLPLIPAGTSPTSACRIASTR